MVFSARSSMLMMWRRRGRVLAISSTMSTYFWEPMKISVWVVYRMWKNSWLFSSLSMGTQTALPQATAR